MKKLLMFLLTGFLVIGFASSATAASVIFDDANGELDSVAGTFTFDILVGDIGGLVNLDAWNLDFTITRLTDPGDTFSFHYVDVSSDTDYVFFGDSQYYDFQISPPNPPDASQYDAFAGDLTASGSGGSGGNLLATLILDDVAAYVVSVPNRTVITAFDRATLQDGVFTSIDSAVIL